MAGAAAPPMRKGRSKSHDDMVVTGDLLGLSPEMKRATVRERRASNPDSPSDTARLKASLQDFQGASQGARKDGVGAPIPSELCEDAHALREFLRATPGADADTSTDHVAPLMHACFSQQPECVQLLLSAGANTKAGCGKRNLTALHLVTESKFHESTSALILMLVGAGADVNQGDANGATPLFIACKGGKTECARLLVEMGADVNRFVREGKGSMTPLTVACLHGHEGCVAELLKGKADPRLKCVPTNDWVVRYTMRDKGGGEASPLNCVVLGGSIRCAERLIAQLSLEHGPPARGAQLDPGDADTAMALRLAYSRDHTEIAAEIEAAFKRFSASPAADRSMYARLKMQSSSYLGGSMQALGTQSPGPSTPDSTPSGTPTMMRPHAHTVG